MSIDPGSDPSSDPGHREFAESNVSDPVEGSPTIKRAGRRLLTGAVAFVVLLGALGFFLLRGSSGTALALSFSQGQTTRWHMTLSMDASIAIGSGTTAQSVPLTFTSSSDVQWRVVSVDAAGTATVKATVSNLSVTSSGQSRTVPNPPAVTIHVTRDGRVVSSSGLTISSGSEHFPGLDGADQLSALLPDHAVKPGDTWSKSATRTMFGSTVTIRASATYLRNEMVGAVDAAVIQTKQATPLRLTLTASDLTSILPGLRGSIPSKVKFAYSGQVAGTSNAWIDPSAKKLLKVQGTGRFSIQIAVTGLPSGSGLGSLHMSGTESVTLQPR